MGLNGERLIENTKICWGSKKHRIWFKHN
jgi:hypothetical protein